ELADELRRLAERVLPVCYHPAVFRREARFLRHALAHLLRGHDPLAERVARCVTAGGAYHVPRVRRRGLAEIARLLDPETIRLWCPAVERGLRALGLFPDTLPCGCAERFAAMLAGFERLRRAAPDLTTPQLCDFLERVSRMTGRELPAQPGSL